MKREQGFTILELFIAFMIFSLVFTVLGFSFINFLDQWKLEEASIYLLTNLRLFQEGASSQKDYYDLFEFYPNIDLCIWKVYNSSSKNYKVFKVIDLKKYNVDLISADFGGLSFLYFNPLGIPSGGGTVVLGKKNLRKYVIVTPATGRIWVSDSPPVNW